MRTALLVVVSALFIACGGGGGNDQDAGADAPSQQDVAAQDGPRWPFLPGRWDCEETQSLSYTTPFAQTVNHTWPHSMVTVVDNGDGTFTVTPDGAPDCHYVYTVSGESATLVSNSTCHVTNTDMNIIFSFQTGTVTMIDALDAVGNSTYTFSGTQKLELDGGLQTTNVAGTGTTTNDCVIEQ